jgi:hypothetical protein
MKMQPVPSTSAGVKQAMSAARLQLSLWNAWNWDQCLKSSALVMLKWGVSNVACTMSITSPRQKDVMGPSWWGSPSAVNVPQSFPLAHSTYMFSMTICNNTHEMKNSSVHTSLQAQEFPLHEWDQGLKR